ncbi:hypothetical protein CkaCkLH20_06236 [Colletotrichum karsti]|uniref:Uncharacterized protein n=1 Tax=Colletotrichum karsti TaxID=1095194 RepID=A0A9P6I2V0_9PEZI|nr:uncharacterized protein CkaCkLH20_06236 [Colletotrichum karsti]KAF9876293.1 hypothetical protein CkaCkLH20_06236 [Colletotrichum karsti]
MSLEMSTCPANYTVTQTTASTINSKPASIYLPDYGVPWPTARSEDNMSAFTWPEITGEPQATKKTKDSFLTVTFPPDYAVPKTECRSSLPPWRNWRNGGFPFSWPTAAEIQYSHEMFVRLWAVLFWVLAARSINHNFIYWQYVEPRKAQIVAQTRVWQHRLHLPLLIPNTGPGISDHAFNSMQLYLWQLLCVYIIHTYF